MRPPSLTRWRRAPKTGWMAAATEAADILPDFCTGARVLRVLLVCEAVAVVLTLGGSLTDDLWRRLFLLSVYLQWIGICSAAALCLLRRHAGDWRRHWLAVLCYLSLLAVTLVITEITFAAGRYTGFGLLLEDNSHGGFVLRSLGICAVVSALSLRYFWLRAAWQQHAELEMRARLEALQARIEPHFLFNTLNSVAALIEPRPRDAETALEDLAVLLRARLASDAPSLTTLTDEMLLVDAYVRIETLRLRERLIMDVDISPAAARGLLPVLCLQPLVENAIGHGVARLPGGGAVSVRGWMEASQLHILVRNPVATQTPAAPGNRQALSNIERRLALRYEDAARLRFTQDDTWFTVHMILPQSLPRSISASS
ncbi:MAG: histidine kinase [Salinisphaera sp.]|jgi:two-component system sensor histidine kinase AlgZ|nr:histidine kinase [Salinisphaera sp.]